MLRARHGIVLAVLGLLVVATVMVNSASLNLSRGGETTLDSVFWGKHTWFALGAAMALLVGAMVPVDRLGRTGATWWTTPVFWVAVAVVVGMALVQVPGIGREANGARRWISLGPIGLQPSEIAKWGVPIMVAWYAIRERARLHTFTWGFAVPLAAVSAVCGLIALEDLGTAVLIELVTVAMLVVAGARGIWVAAMAPVGLLAFVVLVITSPYRVNRIIAFLDPYADARGIGYHIIQSLEAIAGGGVAGRGLGNSELKFGYLPEATTDFIYSIVAEELGIAGSAVVVGLYVLFILCGLAVIGATARGAGSAPPVQSEGGSGSVATATAPATVEPELLSNFARLLGFGILLTVGVQALINICVVTGLAPTKGIALPLMSRGGTGWILTCLSIGLLISMDRGADRRRRELGLPVPGEEQDPFLQPVAHGTSAGTAAGAA
jgi:cell division protein FtsW